MKYIYVIVCLLVCLGSNAQLPAKLLGDSWAQVKKTTQGTVTVIYDGIDPFIYRTKNGQLAGIEYELVEAFSRFVQGKYEVNLKLNWVDAQGFDNILPYLRNTKQAGILGVAYFSITNERKQFVNFTPPYMPDVNVLVTNEKLPNYVDSQAFVQDIKRLNAYTMANTTMATDVQNLSQRFYSALNISTALNDYEVLTRIATDPQAFGYLPLSIYIVGLQNGIKVKRQPILASRRPGFALAYPLGSDWQQPLEEYFASDACKHTTNLLIKKYLGSQMSSLIAQVEQEDSLRAGRSDFELLELEKEIVSQRLNDSALEIERQKNFQNALLFCIALGLGLAGFFVYRYRSRRALSNQLMIQNTIISQQKKAIEATNKQLEMRILQARMNPRFIANSLAWLDQLLLQAKWSDARQYLLALNDFTHQLAQNTDSSAATIAEEASLLSKFLHAEQIRSGNIFEYSVHIAELSLEQERIPSFFIRPFVENAVNATLATCSEGFVHLSFLRRSRYVVVRVEHCGETTMPDFQHDELFKARLDLLNKQAKHPVEVQQLPLKNAKDAPFGTLIEIALPIA